MFLPTLLACLISLDHEVRVSPVSVYQKNEAYHGLETAHIATLSTDRYDYFIESTWRHFHTNEFTSSVGIGFTKTALSWKPNLNLFYDISNFSPNLLHQISVGAGICLHRWHFQANTYFPLNSTDTRGYRHADLDISYNAEKFSIGIVPSVIDRKLGIGLRTSVQWKNFELSSFCGRDPIMKNSLQVGVTWHIPIKKRAKVTRNPYIPFHKKSITLSEPTNRSPSIPIKIEETAVFNPPPEILPPPVIQSAAEEPPKEPSISPMNLEPEQPSKEPTGWWEYIKSFFVGNTPPPSPPFDGDPHAPLHQLQWDMPAQIAQQPNPAEGVPRNIEGRPLADVSPGNSEVSSPPPLPGNTPPSSEDSTPPKSPPPGLPVDAISIASSPGNDCHLHALEAFRQESAPALLQPRSDEEDFKINLFDNISAHGSEAHEAFIPSLISVSEHDTDYSDMPELQVMEVQGATPLADSPCLSEMEWPSDDAKSN